MEVILIRALQLVMALSLLVILHEGGHFFFARLFKIRVEKFCLFFDPWFALFRWKPKNSDTEYGIGWVPLGGYVKISGMIDESMDSEQMKQPEQPWEFRSKPAWQRLLVMVGGVFVNFVLALFIYAMVLFTWGEHYVPVQNWTQGMSFNESAKQIGFRDGDVLLATEKGQIDVKNMGDLFRTIAEARQVTVMRQTKQVTLQMPAEMSMLSMVKEVPPFMEMLVTNRIDSVLTGMPGAKAGLQRGDVLIAFNGVKIDSYNQFRNEMGRVMDQTVECSAKDSLRLRRADLVVLRCEKQDTLHLMMTPDFKIGFTATMPDYKEVEVQYGFWESFPAGARHGWNVLAGYVNDMKYVFTKEGAQSVGGFATIGSIFPATWDWYRFWSMTAFLSIILAFMNILPIPALDGGHVLFLLYEVITRRKPSEKFLERAQVTGMVLLMLLMLWANFNDIVRFLF